jgi:uncharacterized membrane protein YbhN (UPF0104 family)
MIDWLSQLWDTVVSISLPLLILGLALQTTQTLFVALAWRNILRAAYPEGALPYRQVLSYYAGGTGLNSILPASAGTVAMLGLFRTSIEGSTVAGLVGATVAQNVFFAVVMALMYLWLFLGTAGSFDVKLGWFDDNSAATVIILVAGTALIVVALRILWRRLHETWENAKDGGVILGQPRKYAVEVVAVEAASYVARMGVNATFMYAYDIPVSLQNVFLIVAASSLSSTIAIAPGAVGAQTALASVVLKDVAPQATITAYTVGQGLITTAWNAVFGLTMLSRSIGWAETRKLIHVRKKDEDAALEAIEPGAAPAIAGAVSLEGGDGKGDPEAEGGHHPHHAAAVLERFRHHRVREHGEDRPGGE